MKFTVNKLSPKLAEWEFNGDKISGQLKPSAKLFAFAGKHGLDANLMVEEAKKACKSKPKTGRPTQKRQPVVFKVRPINANSSANKEAQKDDPIEGFREALGLYPDCESVISWKGLKSLALLDVDYHHCEPPPRHRALALLSKLRPIPFCSWISHGCGLHALYHAQGGLDAEEVAACAAINIKSLSPQSAPEVISITRHPYHGRVKNGVTQTASPLQWRPQSLDAMVSQWRGGDEDSVSDEDVAEWLLNSGMSMDGRYPHTMCPYDPCTGKGNDPVVVTDTGILCHRCRGTDHSSRGFSPWSKLIRGRSVSRIVSCAKRFTPWDHAKFVVNEDYGDRISKRLLEKVYVALCKSIHGADHPNIWRISDSFQCVRSSANTWIDSDTFEPISPPPKPGRLQDMPGCRKAWKDEAGEWETAIDAKEIDKLSTNQKLVGWPGIIPIRGIKVWGRYLPYGDKRFVRGVIHDDTQWPQPKYLSEGDRLSEEECEKHIETCFPEINVDYLKLLIVARGFAESGTGKVPIIVSTGPSGAGKSIVCLLAASILGDHMVKVPKGNYQETVGYSAYQGGFLLLDEFAKGLAGDSLRKKFDFLLEIDRDFSFRQLHVGPVTARINNVILVANNAYDAGLFDHKQICRRAVHVGLNIEPEKDWATTCGTGDVRLWRRETYNQRVADSFLSYIVDDYFSDIDAASKGRLSFVEAAKEVGFGLLLDSQEKDVFEGMDTDDVIREFFVALQRCEDHGDHVVKYKGRGWRVFNINDTNHEAAKLWRELCDDPTDREKKKVSMKLSERDLSKVLGVSLTKKEESVKFHVRLVGQKLICKFQHKFGTGRTDYRTNGDIETSFKIKETP